jgi:hypothetical protein
MVPPSAYDWLAAESAKRDRLERGLASYMIGPELADEISRTSLVGHPA